MNNRLALAVTDLEKVEKKLLGFFASIAKFPRSLDAQFHTGSNGQGLVCHVDIICDPSDTRLFKGRDRLSLLIPRTRRIVQDVLGIESKNPMVYIHAWDADLDADKSSEDRIARVKNVDQEKLRCVERTIENMCAQRARHKPEEIEVLADVRLVDHKKVGYVEILCEEKDVGWVLGQGGSLRFDTQRVFSAVFNGSCPEESCLLVWDADEFEDDDESVGVVREPPNTLSA